MIKELKMKTLSILLVSTVVGLYTSSAWSQVGQNVDVDIVAKEDGLEVKCYGETFYISGHDINEAQKKCDDIKKQQAEKGPTEAQRARDASAISASAPPSEKEDVKAEDEADVKETNFTGIAREYQVMPNTLAIYCQANAEDLAADRIKMMGCVNKIVSKLNSDRAYTLQDVTEPIRIEMLEEAMMLALSKTADKKAKEDVKEQISESSSSAKTNHEDITASVHNISYLAESILDMQNLLAEPMKYKAFTGIYAVDASVVKDEEKREDTVTAESKGLTGEIKSDKASVTKVVEKDDESEADEEADDSDDFNPDGPVMPRWDTPASEKASEDGSGSDKGSDQSDLNPDGPVMPRWDTPAIDSSLAGAPIGRGGKQ